jgi:tRNA G18 (ribose-2'-O)-methylase SpoU
MSPKVINIRTSNTAFHHLSALRNNRIKRTSEGKFIVEGVRSINNAVKYGWDIKGWVYSSDHRLSSWGQDILQKAAGAKHYRVTDELLRQLSQKDEASELLAVMGIPKDGLKRIAVSDEATVIVFDRPSSPGNLGAIMRSADAFGVSGIIVTGHGIDPYSQETVSASTGSFFAIPIVRLPSHKEVAAWVESLNKLWPKLSVIATDEKADEQIDRHKFSGPTVLLIGNETHGLSNAYRGLADRTVSIPMGGSASSLNAAVATSITLYEIQRQRRQKA